MAVREKILLSPKDVTGEVKYVVVRVGKRAVVRFVDPLSCAAHFDAVDHAAGEKAIGAGRVRVERRPTRAHITEAGSFSLGLTVTNSARDLALIKKALRIRKARES